MSPQPGSGLALLRERVARVPDALARIAPVPAGLARRLAGVRRVVVTGAGSSAAQAELLVDLLAEAAVPARFLPASGLLAGASERGWEHDALVVISQGLPPNGRLAVARAGAFRRALLVTSVPDDVDDPERAACLAGLRAAGGDVVRFPGYGEAGPLVRVLGPVAGTAATLHLARALAEALGEGSALPAASGEALGDAFREAFARGLALAPGTPDPLDGALALLAGGRHTLHCGNLATKLMEGLLVARPPVFDLLGVAHGGYQQLLPRRATFLVLEREDAPNEAELVTRLASMLETGRHRLLRLPARLPGPWSLVEHEALLDALLLRAMEARGIEPLRWPGRGRDGPLYGIDAPEAPGPAARHRSLDDLTWPELEAAVASGVDTAIVPLGSTEQHGPHLPFATDTWIADAVAARLCGRVGRAVRLPVLPLGCASEHAAFPGTLSLREESLVAVLEDVLASLGRAGLSRLLVFSAHGGNLFALRRHGERLRAAAPGASVVLVDDHAALTARLHEVARAAGVAPAAAGQHAGELETSILLDLAPGHVREARARPGRMDAGADAPSLFYPDLRANAPDGVVGDPTLARAERAEAYLAAWVDVLAGLLEDAKKRQCTNGTKNA